jgi:hypothetical protein
MPKYKSKNILIVKDNNKMMMMSLRSTFLLTFLILKDASTGLSFTPISTTLSTSTLATLSTSTSTSALPSINGKRGPFVLKATSTTSTTSTSPQTKIESYDEAISIIDKCSQSSTPSDNLYKAVQYIDRNANTKKAGIYPTLESKEQMWEKAYGSWKLVLATGGGKFTTFKPVPIFAFAYIDEIYFGNGIGINEDMILLSLLGPHVFNAKRRQMQICIDDIFLLSNNLTNVIPEFLTKKIDLKKRPEDFSGKKGDRIPAFTIIASSDTSLVARGGTGGVAIWTRLEKDIQSAAYSM